MTAVDVAGPGLARPAVPPAPGRAVTRLAVRQVRRGALVVGLVVAGMSALVVATYESTLSGAADVAALRALAENPAIRTLFGEPVALDDPGGFAVWRTGTVVGVLVGVWGLLTATRVTRGEEDAGRWDLLLAGRVPLRTVVAGHLGVICAALLVIGGLTAVAMIAAGTTVHGAVLHGAGVGLTGVFFAAAGILAAQLFPTRGAASGAATALLGAALLARMLGDGNGALGWLRWLSPFGLTALVRPFEADRALPLVVLALAAAAAALAASAAAARRDLRGGWTAPSTGREPQRALLGSVSAFALRRSLRPLAGWSAGIGAYYLLIGVLAVSVTTFLAENAQFGALAADAGFAGLDAVEGYAAALLTLLAVPVGVFTAVRTGAHAQDEQDRRHTLLLAGPVSRSRLLGAEVAVTASGAVVLVATAGLALWAGSAAVGAPLTAGAALAGALNVLPVVALCLGAAVLALGLAPGAVVLVGSLPAVGGFLLQVLADSVGAPEWVGGLSPFAHLAPVPAAAPDVAGGLVMLGVAAGLGAAGVRGYRRRDLRG
ncbi:MAG: polyketide antibiotic transporter [Pseudonocardia sp.]|nr:polyketide antibiotic transporter [Pseudonocardia sp.]